MWLVGPLPEKGLPWGVLILMRPTEQPRAALGLKLSPAEHGQALASLTPTDSMLVL